jgi:hypothetical protein
MSRASDAMEVRGQRILNEMRAYNELLKTVVEHNDKIMSGCERTDGILCEMCQELVITIPRPETASAQ